MTARGRAGLRVGARGRVAGEPEASGGAWRRVGACLESQKLLAARGARARPDPADFGLNGQIVMRSIQ